MTFKVDDLYKKGIQTPIEFADHQSFIEATNLITNRLRNGGIALVWGPPGTGKTTTYVNAITRVLDDIINSSDLLLYIAPTNQLVAEMSMKIASIYAKFQLGQKDFLEHIRVYGSQFSYNENNEEFSKLLKPPGENTKVILTTAYQIPYLQKLDQVDRIHIMIDEASKSPLHVPFIPLSQEFLEYLKEKKERTSSLNILGDPMQAIGIDELKGRRDLLLFLKVCKGLLNKPNLENKNILDILTEARKDLEKKYLVALDLTFRMPSPSEEPISYGFYDGILRAANSAESRLRGLWDKKRAQELTSMDETFKRVVKSLESSLTTGRPIIYVHTKERHEYKDSYGELFDKKRAEIGLYYATALAYITNEPVSVITTYVDQAHHMKNLYLRDFSPVFKNTGSNISFLTVHRALGSENEHIVAILGKEYAGEIGEETLYYAEPEVFNVQLSRHRKTLIIVGNLQKMYNTINELHRMRGSIEYMSLKQTVQKILELCGAEIEKRKLNIRKEGEGGTVETWE